MEDAVEVSSPGGRGLLQSPGRCRGHYRAAGDTEEQRALQGSKKDEGGERVRHQHGGSALGEKVRDGTKASAFPGFPHPIALRVSFLFTAL